MFCLYRLYIVAQNIESSFNFSITFSFFNGCVIENNIKESSLTIQLRIYIIEIKNLVT